MELYPVEQLFKSNRGHKVAETDPTDPLFPGAQSPSETEPEQGNHFGERTRPSIQHYAKAKMHYPDASRSGGLCGCFPCLAEIRKKAGPAR